MKVGGVGCEWGMVDVNGGGVGVRPWWGLGNGHHSCKTLQLIKAAIHPLIGDVWSGVSVNS